MIAHSPALWSARKVAAYLGVSLRTIWRWREMGQLPPPVRAGSLVRWKAVDIEAFVQKLPIQSRGRKKEGTKEG